MGRETQQTPLQAYEDAALKAAFSRMLEKECRQLMAEEPSPEDALLLEQLEQRFPQQLARLDKTVHRRLQLQRAWAGTKAFLRSAAAILAIVFVGLSTAVAANEPFRNSLVEFLTEETPEFIEFGFGKNPAAPDVPEGWTAEYYPSYLPEGYELLGYTSTDHSSKAIFDQNGDHIFFSTYTTPNSTQINARNAQTKNIRIHDCSATLVTLDGESTVVWSEGDAFFSVTSSSPQMAIDTAESISSIPR